MSTLPPIKRITREDLKGSPEWVDRLLYPLNLFFNSVYASLNKGITFSENIISQEISFSLTAGSSATDNTAKFSVSMKTIPTGLLLKRVFLQSGNYTPIGNSVFIEWYYEDSYINIMSISGLNPGSVYDFNILLI